MAEPPKADESLTGGEPPVAKTYPPRPIPSVDPRPITLADFEDEQRPGLLAGVKPRSAWLALGAAAVGVAFVLGLVIGRRSASAPVAAAGPPVAPAHAEAPKVAAASPVPAPAVTQAQALEVAPAASPSPAPALSVAAAAFAPPSASADASKSSAKSVQTFNATAAKTNLGNAASRVRSCKDASVPAGSVSAVITFAPSGRVSDVTVTTPTYASGKVGSCIVSKLKTARVPPFTGPPETVKKVIAMR